MTERAYLREFEQLVLLSVLRLGDEAHGGRIRRDLEETAGRSVSVATIYVALSRMERRGFVRSWMSDPTPVRGGKSKKHYALEPEGEDVWLNPDAEEKDLLKLLKPCAETQLIAHPVSKKVNNPTNDYPELLESLN